MADLLQKVLDYNEPDRTKQAKWLQPQPMAAPDTSPAMEAVKERLLEARDDGEKVIVCGDYDCDGILAASILTDGLRRQGIETGFYIPDRLKEGYGLRPETVQLAADKGYTLLITVDNGVKAKAALDKARELDLDVIVTDHHRMDEPVNSDWILHPDLMDESYKTLCGAGVAYELLRSLGWDTPYHLLLAGTASVGDMMEVTGQTRALIQQAIHMLNGDRDQHMQRLCQEKQCSETTIAFQIVPKLNAIGRLSNLANANNVVRYFLSDDPVFVSDMARQISRINDTRKQISEQMVQLAKSRADLSQNVLFIEDESFHEGIIGLAAGSLCASFGKPVIVAARNTSGYKASMRAPAGFDCMEFLHGFEGLAEAGGHTAAAGFSLDLQERSRFVEYACKYPVKEMAACAQEPGLVVEPEDLSIAGIQSLDILRPFGPGFELPPFILEKPCIKNIADLSGGRHRRYTLNNGLQCMRFSQPASEAGRSVIDIAAFKGTVQVRTWQGRTSSTFIIDEIIYES